MENFESLDVRLGSRTVWRLEHCGETGPRGGSSKVPYGGFAILTDDIAYSIYEIYVYKSISTCISHSIYGLVQVVCSV